MSDFTAGFSSRHVHAGEALRRAFAAPEGFAPVDPGARVADKPAPNQPRHFEPADRAAKPTQGWDMFDPEIDQPMAAPAPQPFVDPIAVAHDKGYAEGLAAARAEIEAATARDRALVDALGRGLADAAHFDRERFAQQLRQTVLHLVTRLVGEIGVSPERLAGRIDAAVDLLADAAESSLVRLHPDDVRLIEGRLPDMVFAAGDPSIARGSFIIESASTIVEDGPEQWIEQLTAAIDRVPLPAQC
ncbi:FliH/SctL family protein [Sphingomonas sp. 37zxx]|uniref:FliH/SctL family protein n=1 Tax=Sphingomonas sp. 37zxx TaxID=1550073 RepID=UPI00053C027D|nr:FliH/SctL family protein [Sphingomonas sp. 37zxx]